MTSSFAMSYPSSPSRGSTCTSSPSPNVSDFSSSPSSASPTDPTDPEFFFSLGVALGKMAGMGRQPDMAAAPPEACPPFPGHKTRGRRKLNGPFSRC